MIKIIHINIFVLLVFCCARLFAQDQLLFLNGKELKGELVEVTKYETTFKGVKGKNFLIDNYRIFSYKTNSKETLLYKFDTLEGNFLSEQDMRMFVFGEREAFHSYNSWVSNTIGFAAGGFAGYFMHKDQAFVYAVVPLIYTSFTLVFPTSVKQRKIEDLQFIKDDEFLRGHDRVARSKRTQNALKCSFIGLGTGFLVSFLAHGATN